MSAKTIAEFEDVKIRTKLIEDSLEESLTKLIKNQTVQYDRCSDHGKRGFYLNILFDDLNVDGFKQDNVEKILALLSKFKALRLEQKIIERKMNEEHAIEQQLSESMRIV